MDGFVETLLTYKAIVIGVWLAVFFIGERVTPSAEVPLDRSGKIGRLISNAGLFGANTILSLIMVVPFSLWAASVGPEWRAEHAPWWGGIGGLMIDLLLLDFMIYWWHRLNHVSQFLWRFHEIHHLDATLDSTTAVRFHFGEVAMSAVVRGAYIIALDIPIESVLIFEVQVLLAAIFNHSNIKLPRGLERVLGWVVVTPAIHWIHHHAIRRDTDSNYGNLFSFWDRLFGSFSPTRRTPDMKIGVEREPEKPTLRLFVRPFESR